MAPDACNDCFYYRPNDNLNQRLGQLLVQNNGLPGVIYVHFIWLWGSPPACPGTLTPANSIPIMLMVQGNSVIRCGVTVPQGSKDARANIRCIHHGRYFSWQ